MSMLFDQSASHLRFDMADKLNGFAARLSQGAPKGLGLGVKVLIGASALGYGVFRSLYTGNDL